MSTFSRIVDTTYALRFLRLLTTPWTQLNAYKRGIIDGKGKQLLKSREVPPADKQYYTIFHRLVFNVKRLLQKTPIVGRSILTSYVAGLLMLREGSSEDEIKLDVLLDALINEAAPQLDDVVFVLNEDNNENVHQYQLNPNDSVLALRDLVCIGTGDPLIDEGSVLTVIEENQEHQGIYLCEDNETGLRTLIGFADVFPIAEMVTAAASGVTSNAMSAARPFGMKQQRRHSVFDVDDDVFNNFTDYRKKHSKWSQYVPSENEHYNEIKKCVQRGDMVVLRDSKGRACAIRSTQK